MKKPGLQERQAFLLERLVLRVSTTRTSNVTLSQFRTAPKMAAKLSMLGLPVGESMRWRLLLGL